MALDWPGTLPSCFEEAGYAEGRPDNLIRSSDYGGFLTEVRRRSTAEPFPAQGTMPMSGEEWATLWEFFHTDLADGALEFILPAQGTDEELNWSCRFLRPPTRKFLAEDLWRVSLELEVLGEEEAEPVINPGPLENISVFYAATVAIFNTDFTLTAQRYTDPDTITAGFVLLDQDLIEPPLYTDADAFYAPTVARGARTLSPSVVTDTDTIYAPNFGGAFVTLTPALYTDADTPYTPTVLRSTRTLTPARYDDADTFYGPSIARGARTLTPSLYTDADSFYAPSVSSASTYTSTYSLRVADTAELYSRTQGTGTSRRVMTFSYFYWKDASSSNNIIISKVGTSINAFELSHSGGLPRVSFGGGTTGLASSLTSTTNDAWTHIVVQIDTTNATANQRVKIWQNGSAASMSFPVAVTQNQDTGWGLNAATETVLQLGGGTAGSQAVDEFVKIDGQLLGPSSFASSNAPIDVSGLTFGNQGYWLDFETGAASTAGNDVSGNGLNFTNTNYEDADLRPGYPSNPE